jgi:trans-aconitate 2-methyltransferase
MTREWDASSYHRLSDPQHSWGQKVLQRIAPRGDETVIDAGCGTARLTTELAALIPRGRVIAVDLSENMLRQAREYLAVSGGSAGLQSGESKAIAPRASARAPIHLVCADLAALPFNSIADGIFSTAAFHWVGDHEALFRSLFTALKPGGWLIAQCGGGPNLLRLRQRTDEVMNSPEFQDYFRGWSPPQNYATAEETAARLRRAGFSDVATWLHNQDTRFADEQTFHEFLATVTCHTHIARIPDPTARARFLDRLVALAQQEPELHLDYWRLNIHARKN